jgi:endonuclease YncB( thermonuclease family)
VWTSIRTLTTLLCVAALAAVASAWAVTGEAIGPQTIRLDTGEEADGPLPVDLGGIRAPDLRDTGSAHAQEYLAFLLQGRSLSLERYEEILDEGGRRKRHVWLRRVAEGDLVNREMVRAGYAAAYVTRARDPEAEPLIQAEIEARQQRRGLWATTGQPERYIGSIRSRIFHTPACQTLPTLRHVIPFETRDQAIRCYYRPCRICLPF